MVKDVYEFFYFLSGVPNLSALAFLQWLRKVDTLVMDIDFLIGKGTDYRQKLKVLVKEAKHVSPNTYLCTEKECSLLIRYTYVYIYF